MPQQSTDVGRKPSSPDTSDYRGRFAARLRELRLKRYGSQAEFAEHLRTRGVNATPTTVSGWETGYRTPDFNLLPAIADALGVTVTKLFPPH